MRRMPRMKKKSAASRKLIAAAKRAKETYQERQARLEKCARYSANKRANESEQERKARLERVAQYMAKRRANENEQKRKARLERDAQYSAFKRANESEQERKARLERDARYKANKRAYESEQKRKRTELGLTQSMPSCSFTSAEPPTRIGVDGNNEGDAAGGKVKQELMEEEELKPMLTVTVPPIKEELFEEEYENILEDPLEYDSM